MLIKDQKVGMKRPTYSMTKIAKAPIASFTTSFASADMLALFKFKQIVLSVFFIFLSPRRIMFAVCSHDSPPK